VDTTLLHTALFIFAGDDAQEQQMSTKLHRRLAAPITSPVGRASTFFLKSLVGLLVVMVGEVIPPF
jgi:hypothetical protein